MPVVLYSMRDMKRTFTTILAMVCGALACAGAAETQVHWAKGVSQQGGWYDFDKTFTTDRDMCWAAAASNVIAWWQDRNKALTSTAGAPTGPAVWDTFKQSFNNISGDPIDAMQWYFDGQCSDNTIRASLTQYGQDKGGYYADLLEGEPQYKLSSIMGLAQYDFTDPRVYTSVLCNLLDQGYGIALGIAGNMSDGRRYGHAITLWAAEVNPETGILSKIWITDPDDVADGQPKGLVSLSCSFKNGDESSQYIAIESDTLTGGVKQYPHGEAVLAQFYAVGSNITSWQAPAVPEPATGTLGLLALAALAARRRMR